MRTSHMATIVVFATAAQLNAAAETATVRASAPNTPVRDTHTLAGAVVTLVSADTILEALDYEEGWYWVLLERDQNGTRHAGWIRADDVGQLTGVLPLRSPVPEGDGDAQRLKHEARLSKAKRALDEAQRKYNALTSKENHNP